MKTSVSLGSHFTAFIDAQIQSGRYGSVSEIICSGLRLLEEQELKQRMALQDALRAGEHSGEPVFFDSETFLANMKMKHGQ